MTQNNLQLKNPYSHEEFLFSELVNLDTRVQTKMQSDFQNFYSIYISQNIKEANNQFNLNKLFYFLTHNLIALAILITLGISAITVSALEIFGPDEFKPSTTIEDVFKIKKDSDQPDTTNTPTKINLIPPEDKLKPEIQNPIPEPKKIVTETIQTKQYTNPFFPNFELNYDESWEFETSTTPNPIYEGFLDRDVFLKKSNLYIKFNLIPSIVTGCIGGYPSIEGFPVGESLFRYKNADPNNISIYTPTNIFYKECYLSRIFTIRTNIITGFSGGDPVINKEDGSMQYWMFISTNASNEEEFSQVEQILKNSNLK